MPDEVPTLAEAFALAEAEIGMVEPVETPFPSPGIGEDAAAVAEQPEDSAYEPTIEASEENPLAGLDPDEQEQGYWPEPGTEDWWQLGVEVQTSDGLHTVTIDELRNGYMRQADYTRKTQEVARERQLTSEALEFFNEFKADPHKFAKFVAWKAGLVDEEAPVPAGVRLYTEDEVMSAVAARVEQQLAEHPTVVAARQAQAVQALEGQLNGIEAQYGVSLNRDARLLILREAKAQATTNLPLVYEALAARAAHKRAQATATAQSSASRPGTPPRGDAPAVAEPTINSLADAWELAEAELMGG